LSDEIEQVESPFERAADELPGDGRSDAAAPGEPPAPVVEPESERAQLERAQLERDEYLEALKRLKAEFDNYRKRVAREQSEFAARAAERLVKQLVPLLDDLERALDAASDHGEAALGDGVRLVHRALADVLAREGLREVATDGPFDPHTQEALLGQPSEAPEGTVIQVLQKGYALGDRIVRPARVVVSQGLPPSPAPEPEQG